MFSNDASYAGEHLAAWQNCLCRIKWQVEAGLILKAPVTAGSLVIAASLEHGSERNFGFLRAFDAETGAPRWQFNGKDNLGIAGGITTTPAVTDGLVLFGSGLGSFNAIDIASGRLVWEFETGSDLLTDPAIRDGTIYFGGTDGFFYALEVRSGNCRWKYPMEARVYAPPIFAGTTVYLANEDGGLYAFTRDGNLIWRAELRDMRPISLAISADVLLISALSQGMLVAFDLTNRRSAWTFQVQGDSIIIPAVAAGTVCVSGGGNVMGLDLVSGKRRWIIPSGGETKSPLIVKRTAVVARQDGKICGVDILSGVERWTCEVGQPISSEILVDKSILYFGSGPGTLVGLQ